MGWGFAAGERVRELRYKGGHHEEMIRLGVHVMIPHSLLAVVLIALSAFGLAKSHYFKMLISAGIPSIIYP